MFTFQRHSPFKHNFLNSFSDPPRSPCKIVDLIFVMDASSSIPISAWYTQIKVVNSLLPYFDIWPSRTNVGIIEYGDKANIRSQIDVDGIYLENLQGILGQMQ